MAIKPRTFRRIVLLGSLVSVFIAISLLYFVVRPWQNQRQLDTARAEGLAAVEAGDHIEVVGKLGRYLRQHPEAEPKYYLEHARSRLKYQAADGGHVAVAIQSYREYLKAVPDDIEVAKELLPLFNARMMYVEAQSLAESLRTKFNDHSVEVIREELFANRELNNPVAGIEELFGQILTHDDVAFQDLFGYVEWMRSQDRYEEARAQINARIEAGYDDVDTQLVVFWIKITSQVSLSREELVADLSSIIGLDPVAGAWLTEPGYLDSDGTALVLDRLYNTLRRQDLSLAVRLASARINKDRESLFWLARRLYWARDYEELYQIDLMNSDGESIPDVLAYQILAHKQSGEDEDVAALLIELDNIKLDFRAQAWSELFRGMELLNDDQSTQARPIVEQAIEEYGSEPTFHLVMGDIHIQQGRLAQAKVEWDLAHKLANEVGVPYVVGVGNVQWIEPYVRIISAYTQVNRLAEVISLVDELTNRIAPANPVTTFIAMRSYATMARSNDLGYEHTRRILDVYERVADQLSSAEKIQHSPQIATLYASIDRDEEAAALLSAALASSPGEQVLLEVLSVDQFYGLGVAQASGVDMGGIAMSSPQSALQFALNEFRTSGDIDGGLAVIDQGASDSDGEAAYEWGKIRVRYLDTAIDDQEDTRAVDAWKAISEQHPDDIDLLYQMAESKAFGQDVAAVNALIDEIVQLTKIQGEALPSRLLLARASAIANQRPMIKSSRDEAIQIVRGVVVSEQENIRARNMLGRLLELKSSPVITKQEEMFEPDIEAAITEYVTISRQLKGRAAQNYLLQVVDLSVQINDSDSAKQYLFEFDSRFPNDYQVLPEVARRLVNINDQQTASTIYTRIYENTQSVEQMIDAGLSLANVYISQSNRPLANSLLSDLSKEPEMNADQLVGLASLFAKNGYKPEGDEIAASGARFGLEPIDAKMAFARYAGIYISNEVFESTLREIVAEDSTREQAWLLLIRRLIREERFDEAQELAAQAKISLPESSDIKGIAILAKGEFASASELIESGAIESNDFIKEAVRLVDQYIAAKDTASNQELVFMLTSMLQKYEEFLPIQRFGVAQLNGYSTVNPLVLATAGDKASRYFPGDSQIMRVTADAYLRAQRPNDSIRIAQLWRSNVLGSPMEADIAIAQAYIQLEEFTEASDVLGLYINGAVEKSDNANSAKVLFGYTHSQLKLGEKPQIAIDRLESLLSVEDSFAKQVWFNLIQNSVPTHEEAAKWLSIVTAHANEQELFTVANLWLVVMNRFDVQIQDYAQVAIDILGPMVESSPKNPAYLSSLAQAYVALAKSVKDDESEYQDAYARALSLLDQAAEYEPDNLAHLALGASFATRVEDYQGAESRYRKILAKGVGQSQFLASVQNNIAVLIERRSNKPDELGEALQLCTQATDTVNLPSFWGTRGWVELALGKMVQAESSFQKGVDLDRDHLESWVGLSIVQYLQGAEREQDAASSFARLQVISQSNAISSELLNRIQEQGNPQWASDLSP